MNVLETYKTIVDENGNRFNDRTMVGIHLSDLTPDGEIGNCSFADILLVNEPIVSFIVDKDFYQHIEKFKCLIVDGQYKLVLKDGETYTKPQETEEEKKIRELKEQLAALEAAREYK